MATDEISLSTGPLSDSNRLAQTIILCVLCFMFIGPACALIIVAILPNDNPPEFNMVAYILGPLLLLLGVAFGVGTCVSCYNQPKDQCRHQCCGQNADDTEAIYVIESDLDLHVPTSEVGSLEDSLEFSRSHFEHSGLPIDSGIQMQPSLHRGQPRLEIDLPA